MSNVIQVKRKTTTGVPAAASLAVGEQCYVIPDKDLYIKNQDGTLTLINQTITSGTVAPTGGNDGDIYLQYTT
jgi:hypothetical protein